MANVCDHCGESVTKENLGQSTADTLACIECATKAADGAAALKLSDGGSPHHVLGGEG